MTTPEQMQAAVRSIVEKLPDALEPVGRRGLTRVGKRAVSQYMRDGTGDPKSRTQIRFTRATRRHASRAKKVRTVYGPRPSKKGPLRILTGRLAGAVGSPFKDGFNRRGAVNEIHRSGGVVTFLKGVDLEEVPYARAHEKGAEFSILKTGRTVRVPKRSYLAPALSDEADSIQRDAERAVVNLIRREVRAA